MMSYPYGYTYTDTPLFAIILPILALILVLAGGIALYVLFVRKPNHYHGAAAWLHDFLDFRTSYAERLLRVLYCVTVVGIVISSVILLFTNFFAALALFVFGNAGARIGFEFLLLLFDMLRNLREINRKLPEPTQAAESQPAAPATPPEAQHAPEQP